MMRDLALGLRLAVGGVFFASGLIKGRAGTKVVLTVLRDGHAKVLAITRENLTIPVATSNIVSYRAVKLGDVQLTV